MSASSLASEAYGIACAQRDALARGDIDAFLKGVERERVACDALVEAGVENEEDAATVDCLMGAMLESQALLQSLMGNTTLRLMRLRAVRKAAGAYLKTPPRTALRVREA